MNEVATDREEEMRCIKKVMQVGDTNGFSERGLVLFRLKRPCGKTIFTNKFHNTPNFLTLGDSNMSVMVMETVFCRE